MTQSNVNFHLMIVKAAKNPLFEMIVGAVLDVLLYFLRPLEPKAGLV